MEKLIDKYFEGSLSILEKIEFENLRLNNPEFEKELLFQENVQKAIENNERNILKNKLKSFEVSKNKPRPRRKVWMVAASVIFLIGLGLFYIQNQTVDVYSKYYQPYPNTVAPTVRGGSSTGRINDLKSQAFYAYDNEEYAKAVVLFEKINKVEKNEYANFYNGICNMELGNFVKASELFAEIKSPNPYKNYAIYYNALCYVKMDKNREAIIALKKISNMEEPLKSMVKATLSDLE